ncbi:7-deoxyloganetic acid glucosyltransferase-like [Momordica charantia]|uniref:Glycosyltransferase n=1 Tax=Momordica charantia TaxID=3673 RepID=A0A6J1CBJ1_MOMCH|nr:7-deoxyloganetic acid glucosyltransferase-like [Momordica charantia]
MEMEMEMEAPLPPHVLIFPLPLQGHINSMLKLAEVLSLAGIRVTFLNTHHSHRHLTHNSDVHAHFSRFPGFRFATITDGLPPAHLRTFHHFFHLVTSFDAVTKPLFRHMLVSGHFGSDLTCVILDGFFKFLVDADDDGVRIPILGFRTVSACSIWAYLSVPDLIQDGQLPIRGEEDMDRMIRNVAGMKNVLRCRDLPGFCRVTDPNDPLLQFLVKLTLRSSGFHSLILNSFEDLEAPILSKIRTLCPKMYTIGPLHALLKAKSANQSQHQSSLNNLWEVDRSCLAWLDAQPPNSVIYVSFGSITVMGDQELMEFWHGLVNSGTNFLWVIRPDLVTSKNGKCDEIPAELEEGTRKRGYMVGWAPQEEVLSHGAVGGFLTHSGWNSTLEGIAAGKPMICWPYAADQQVNSRFVSHVWKVGLDMKDVCDRETVAKMVNDLMVNRREEFMRSAAKFANLAKQSVSPGGSSYADFDRLVEDIRLLSQQKKIET